MKYSRLVIALLVVSSFACAKAEKTPGESESTTQQETVQVPSQIFVELDMEKLSASKSGDKLSLSLSDGSTYTLQIQRIEETMPGIVAISAYINDQETGQATLILRDGKLAGSVNMYSDGISYEVGFNEDSDSHYLVPIDPDDRDVLPGGTPPEMPEGN